MRKVNRKISLIILLVLLVNYISTFGQVISLANTVRSRVYIDDINIISIPDVSIEEAQSWARECGATETFISLAPLFEKYSRKSGVNWAIAYVQSAKETGYGKFGGVLNETYFNTCGLKTPAGGPDSEASAHYRFDNWDHGINAHIDHLAIYAGAKGYPKANFEERWKGENLSSNETYDPRHFKTIYGKSPTVVGLGKNWAPSESYGKDIMDMYNRLRKAERPLKYNLEIPSDGQAIKSNFIEIGGWALHPTGTKQIKAYIDNVYLGELSIKQHRPDVNNAYPGYPDKDNSGFYGKFEISNITNGYKSLKLDIIGNNDTIETVETRIVIDRKELGFKSWIDYPQSNLLISEDMLKVGGWVLHPKGIKKIIVSIDEKVLGELTQTENRPDVNNAYPEYNSGDKVGFIGDFDISDITNGIKNLKFEYLANDGSKSSQFLSVHIQKPLYEPKSWIDIPKINSNINSNSLEIGGWAVHKNGIKDIKVSIDGILLDTFKPNYKREDVNKLYPNYYDSINSGFTKRIDISEISNGNKELIFEFTSNDGSMFANKASINISRPTLEPRSWIDNPSQNKEILGKTLKVDGWALDKSGIKNVEVFLDGKSLGFAKTGIVREDVNKLYPGYINGDKSGFEGEYDISSFNNGNKKLEVEITGNDNIVQRKSIDININRKQLPERSWLDSPSESQKITDNNIFIGGWAISENGIESVNVYINDKILGSMKVEDIRTDVGNLYPEYKDSYKSGFSKNFDISSYNNGEYKITVEIIAKNEKKQVYDRKVIINRPVLESKSWIDSPTNRSIIQLGSNIKVQGWALNQSGVKTINMYLDDIFICNAKLGISRQDVGQAYPQYPNSNNSGFEAELSMVNIPEGKKTITLEIIGNDNGVQKQKLDIIIREGNGKLIVVDPGHGGSDPGSSSKFDGNSYIESALNFQVATYLKNNLESNGYKVIMTRSFEGPTATVSLQNRVDIANNFAADMFISIHYNSADSSSVNGFETFYSSKMPNDGMNEGFNEKVQTSKLLSQEICNSVSSELKMYNRGAKDSGYFVVKNTLMPSILVESGFISNREEAIKVSQSGYQESLANIIARSTIQSLKK